MAVRTIEILLTIAVGGLSLVLDVVLLDHL